MSQAGRFQDSGGAPGSTQAFGQVYNTSALSVASNANVTFDTNGPLVNVTHTAGSDTITLAIGGYYRIQFILQTNADIQHITLLQNGVAVPQDSFVYFQGADFLIVGEGVVSVGNGDQFQVRVTTFSGTPAVFQQENNFVNASFLCSKLTPTAGGVGGATSFPTDAGTANEAGGILNILGGAGITTSGAGNTVTVALTGGGQAIDTITGNTGGAVPPDGTGNINLVTQNTTVDVAGIPVSNLLTINFGISNLVLGDDLSSVTTGVRNVGMGLSALNALTSGTDNTAIGFGAGTLISTGNFNTILGSLALDSLTTGSDNTALGDDALTFLTTGSSNIAVGRLSGSAYTGAEAGNITIGHIGVLGDPGYTRIGTSQTKCFIAGIDGVNVGSVAKVVTMASDQLGTATITAGPGITVTPGANTIEISSTGADLLAYTNVNSSPYVVLTTDEFLGVDCSGGIITVQLPNAPSTGRVFIIKDRTGNANINNITVTTVGGAVNIDGATTYVMNTQYASIQVLFDGSTYQIF